MPVLFVIWSAAVTVGCAIWFVAALLNWRMTRLIRPLDEFKSPEPKRWPKVSIIVAACNEADTLEQALRSILDVDYPNLELVIVDDRSTDGTGQVADGLARDDPRIKVVHVTKLPEGWLGKTYALDCGIKAAGGEWFLFTDADVHFSKDVVRKAIALCEDKELDQMGMMPAPWSRDFLTNLAVSAFARLYGLTANYWALDSPSIETHTGVGAFNLVRRSAYERTKGFEWLKLDLGDDVALGLMIARAGGRTYFADGTDEVKVEWYSGLRDLAQGLERVAYTVVGDFTLRKTVIMFLVLLGIELSPWLAVFSFGIPWLQWLGAITVAVGFGHAIGMNMWLKGPIVTALLHPIGSLMFLWVILRGGYVGWRRGGVIWRGTFYPARVLKEGKRVRWP